MELTVGDALKKGVEAHKSGKLQEADQFDTANLKAQSSVLRLNASLELWKCPWESSYHTFLAWLGLAWPIEA